MTTWKITMHRDDGEPEVIYYPDADTSAEALVEASQYAVKRDLPVKTVEIEEA